MGSSVTFAEAIDVAATGDVWLFRGRTLADRTIRVATNAPVNHVGVVLALEDLPPLVWHAELGRSLPDVWAGEPVRGAQLHRLADAVRVWVNRYGQRAWFRHLDAEITPAMEDGFLRVIAEHDGRRFPTTGGLARSWLLGRARRPVSGEVLYCAELVALTYHRMGLLDGRRPPNWYDPGRFWSGDRLELLGGATLGAEVEVTDLPAGWPGDDRVAAATP